MRNIFVGYTKYQLLTFLLLNIENKYFILNSEWEDIFNKEIKKRSIILKNPKIGKFNFLIKFIYLRKKIIDLKIKKNDKFYGENLISNFFIEKNDVFYLEDGVSNYQKKMTTKRKRDFIINFFYLLIFFKKKKSQNDLIEHGIKKLYLTGLAPIPKEIAHKVEIINLKELWNKKSLEEQNEILDIFSFDLNIKDTIKGRDIILFTQPLSEDGVITEEEKIEIYSKIIKKYPQDRLIVKTHPREKTDYKEIFKDNLVLDNPFPFEILNLLDVKFNKAVTIFSTAALGLGKDVAVDFYGTEVNDKILARFGSCDNIMKRNSYLEEE